LTLRFSEGVTLVGGGALSRETFDAARALAPSVVAADGGAELERQYIVQLPVSHKHCRVVVER